MEHKIRVVPPKTSQRRIVGPSAAADVTTRTLLSDEPVRLRPFIHLGAYLPLKSGHQRYGECIFCGKKEKFYVNEETGQWDCKACGKSGNVYSFLTAYYNHVNDLRPTTKEDYDKLVRDRGLPLSAFKNSRMIWDVLHRRWLIPVAGPNGSFIQMRLYEPGKPIKNLSGLDTALWGVEYIKPSTNKIWITEGEWDRLALMEMLDGLKVSGGSPHPLLQGLEGVAVLSAPGANTWKQNWGGYTDKREVCVFYDNDEPGRTGAARLESKILGGVKNMHVLRWGQDGISRKDGFDVRDHYREGGSLEKLMELMELRVSSGPFGQGRNNLGVAPLPQESLNVPLEDVAGNSEPVRSFDELVKVYEKHLYVSPVVKQALRFVAGTIMSMQIKGDPLWVHLVGPAGCGKTELLTSMAGNDNVVVASSVTAASLVSGFQAGGSGDPSLIPKLIGKAFVLKDFTEILRMDRGERDQIYSILRGAYDGEVLKIFGNGVIRQYRGHFTMITGVTHAIEGETDTSLGERFLRFKLASPDDIQAILRRALTNGGNELHIRMELTTAVRQFFENVWPETATPPHEIPEEWERQIALLSEFVARMRTSVDRNFFNDTITHIPVPETGTRVAKQLKKLALGLAMLSGIDAESGLPNAFSKVDFDIVTKCAKDSCPSFAINVITCLHMAEREQKDGRVMTVDSIAAETTIPFNTLRFVLENMVILKLINKKAVPSWGMPGPTPMEYSLSPKTVMVIRSLGPHFL